MQLLFCDDPFHSRAAVDPDYEDEFEAARQSGFATQFFSYESLTKDKDAQFATRRIKRSDSLQRIVYRGWMLKPHQYALLYNALLAKNYRLLNSPVEYQNCHYLPDSYRFMSAHTPKTVWLTLPNQQVNYDQVFNAMTAFGDAPLVVKDFVKSQKHYWDAACYISTAANKENVKSVVERFVELQGTDLNEGLVFRQYVPLNDLIIHSKSGMPLKQEYRLFFFNKELLGCYDYWEEGEYLSGEKPPLDLFKSIAEGVESNFFSMDIAKTKSGEWIIIELGDGQVAGLPDKADRLPFYNRMRQHRHG